MKHIRELLAFARCLGVVDARIENGGKHPKLTGTTPNGEALRYTLPSTPSDGRRGQRNAEADLRKACRSEAAADDGQQAEAGERRRRRRRRGHHRPPGCSAGSPQMTTDACHRRGALMATPASPFDTPAMRALRQRLIEQRPAHPAAVGTDAQARAWAERTNADVHVNW